MAGWCNGTSSTYYIMKLSLLNSFLKLSSLAFSEFPHVATAVRRQFVQMFSRYSPENEWNCLHFEWFICLAKLVFAQGGAKPKKSILLTEINKSWVCHDTQKQTQSTFKMFIIIIIIIIVFIHLSLLNLLSVFSLFVCLLFKCSTITIFLLT